MKVFIFLFTLCISFQLIRSTFWETIYGKNVTTEDEKSGIPTSIVRVTDGHFISGSSQISHFLDSDLGYNSFGFVMKIDLNGNPITAFSMDQKSSAKMIKLSETEFIVAGYLSEEKAIFVMKVDQNMQPIWKKKIADSANNELGGLFSLVEANDGGIVYVGAYDKNTLIVKLDGTTGEIEWAKEFGGDDELDYGTSIISTSDGGFLIGGYTRTFKYIDLVSNGMIIKLDSNGDYTWGKKFNGFYDFDSSETILDIAELSTGEFIILGRVEGGCQDNGSYCKDEEGYLAKYSAEGNLVWAYAFGNELFPEKLLVDSTDENVFFVVARCNRQLYVAKFEYDENAANYHLTNTWLTKSDFDDNTFRYGRGIVENSDQTITVIGHVYYKNMMIINVDSSTGKACTNDGIHNSEDTFSNWYIDDISGQGSSDLVDGIDSFKTYSTLVSEAFTGVLKSVDVSTNINKEINCLCDAYYFLNDTTDTCEACPKGQTKGSVGNELCDCDRGYTRENGECVSCAKGYYKSSTGDDECIACPANSTTETTATKYSSYCICDLGFFKNGYTCVECGEHATTTNIGATETSECVCEIGYIRNDQLVCESCGEGGTTKEIGSNECICDIGYYSADSGCLMCQEYATTNKTGVQDKSECYCDIDYYKEGEDCVPCESGTSKSFIGNEKELCITTDEPDEPDETSDDTNSSTEWFKSTEFVVASIVGGCIGIFVLVCLIVAILCSILCCIGCCVGKKKGTNKNSEDFEMDTVY